MKRLGLILLFPFLIGHAVIVQERTIDIRNTKWTFTWAENQSDYFVFSQDSTFIQYSFEIENEYYGTYQLICDTVVAIVDSAKYMDNFYHSTMKLVVKGDTLRLVYSKHGHMKPKIKVHNNCFYVKDNAYTKEDTLK